jgi:hypothetical protein
MKSYIVTWTIELSADTPQEAANLALEIHRDANSLAPNFVVTDPDTKEGWGYIATAPNKQLAPGDTVYWNDPDNGLCSGHRRVVSIKGNRLTLTDDAGGITEAFKWEVE